MTLGKSWGRVRPTAHFKARLAREGLSHEAAARVLLSGERYRDRATGRLVLVGMLDHAGGKRLGVLVVEEREDEAILVTVFPMSRVRVDHRVRTGRWES